MRLLVRSRVCVCVYASSRSCAGAQAQLAVAWLCIHTHLAWRAARLAATRRRTQAWAGRPHWTPLLPNMRCTQLPTTTPTHCARRLERALASGSTAPKTTMPQAHLAPWLRGACWARHWLGKRRCAALRDRHPSSGTAGVGIMSRPRFGGCGCCWANRVVRYRVLEMATTFGVDESRDRNVDGVFHEAMAPPICGKQLDFPASGSHDHVGRPNRFVDTLPSCSTHGSRPAA